MKNLTKTLVALAAVAVATQTALGESAKSEPAKPAWTPSRSLFIQPDNSREGRDPFYPESTRPFDAKHAASQSAVEINTLTLKGVLGTPGHYVAIINNHAFAVGDEGAVRTQGGTAHVRCVEIRTNTVVVEINGQRHELNLSSK